jgi:basic amino acid/polyamine antiporter, APA family
MEPSGPGGPPGRPEGPTLRRVLGPWLLGILVVGDILGAGIYILVGEVAADVGGLVWLPFLLALALAALTVTSYAELVTAYPHAAGSAHWVKVAYGRESLTFLVGYAVAASAVSTTAAVSRAVGGQYLEAFVDLPVVPVAAAVVAVLATVTWVGISESARANAVMTVVEVGGLVLVVAAGVGAVVVGGADWSRLTDAGPTDPGVFGLVAAVALSFFAYLGFEDAVHLAEEVRDPARAFPRALFGGVAVVGLLYLGVTLSAGVLVDAGDLAASETPLLDVIDAGPFPVTDRVFAAIALVAVTNTALIAITTASRQVYGLAEQRSVPALLGRVGRRRTPGPAILGVAVVAAALASTGGVRELADTTVVLLLAVFTTVNVTVLVLRRRGSAVPRAAGHRRGAPTVVPVVGAIGSLVLLLDAVLVGGLGLLVRVAVLLGIGLVLHALTRRHRRGHDDGPSDPR